jgi:predicted 3-demethylubiquinone-9 3-methyltransferase (glyoxalase superfamily)
MSTTPQKITTFLMFDGRAEEAMTHYTSLFDDAEIVAISRVGAEGPGVAGSVRHATFTLAGQRFMAIDSANEHEFGLTPSVSLFVECADDAEIERVYAALAEGGTELMALGAHGFSTRFGWVTDRFGLSWQLNLA